MFLYLFFLIGLDRPGPFYDANFSAPPTGALSLFANPAGLGINTPAQLLTTYHRDILHAGISLRNLGFGASKADSVYRYESAVGLKLPGAFSLGYALGFPDTLVHRVGVICATGQWVALGWHSTLAVRKHMFAGISFKPFEHYLCINADLEYEGIAGIKKYYFGAALMTNQGSKMFFSTDDELHWHAGLELGTDRVKIAGAYTRHGGRFSAGLLFLSPP